MRGKRIYFPVSGYSVLAARLGIQSSRLIQVFESMTYDFYPDQRQMNGKMLTALCKELSSITGIRSGEIHNEMLYVGLYED